MNVPERHQLLAGRHLAVIGLGESGLAMARWLDGLGARLTVLDDRETPPAAAALAEHCPKARLLVGPLALARFDAADRPETLYWSPGLSTETGAAAELARAARAAGIAVRGELDLFSDELARLAVSRDYRPAILAITGTNGKTTVTQLVAHLCAEAGRDAQVAGNISPALLDALSQRLTEDRLPAVWVLELSSFQLAVAEPLVSTAAVILNFSQNHLDWHPALADYLAAKRRILERAACHVVNIDDPASDPMFSIEEVMAHLAQARSETSSETSSETGTGVDTAATDPATEGAAAEAARIAAEAAMTKEEKLAARAAAREVAKAAREQAREEAKRAKEAAKALSLVPRIEFGLSAPLHAPGFGLVRDGGLTWLAEAILDPADDGARKRSSTPAMINRLMPADALRIRGSHNHANVLAALSLCRAIDLSTAALLRGLRDFEAAAHRCSLVAIHNDVEYIDDSKGTNVGATVAALNGLGKRCILIAGGLGKGQDFSPLAAPVRRHVRAVMLIGRDAPLIRAALQDSGAELVDCATLEEAVSQAASRARAGEAVLLSPASASQDMFRNYPHRAEVFIAAVRRLSEEAGQPC